MAIFRPETKSGTSKFFGVCEMSIIKYEDKSDQFDWADVFIDVTVQQKGSEYTRNIKIAGSLEKDGDGNITGGSVLKRMYNFFDAIGCKAGLNIAGNWEDEKGNRILEIDKYLNEQWLNPLNKEELHYDYIGYIYKEKPKKAGDKAWTRVYPKIYKNTEENKAKLEDDIKWLKGKGFLKELDDVPSNEAPSLQGNGLANL